MILSILDTPHLRLPTLSKQTMKTNHIPIDIRHMTIMYGKTLMKPTKKPQN